MSVRLPQALALVLVLGLSGGVAAGDWQLDPAASRLEFQAAYEGTPAPGAFRRFDVRLAFDPARPVDGKLQVRVPLASFDMGSAEINEAVRAPEWLDLAQFMQAEFTSNDIRAAGEGRYVARGVLRLKGVERELAVPFRWQPEGAGARMSGNVTLDRRAFNVGTGEWAAGDTIGREVRLRFDVHLVPAH